MKSKILLPFVLVLLITSSCRKDSEPIKSRDFIEINGDKRIMDSRIHFMLEHGIANNTFDYEFVDKQFTKKIAGYRNDELQIRIKITESNLSRYTGKPSKTSYPLVDLNNHQLIEYARISIILSNIEEDYYYYLNSYFPTGNLIFNGKTVLEFRDIELRSGNDSLITVSGRFEI